MNRRDAYALVNLSMGRKLLASLGLLTGAALFAGGVALSVLLTNWVLSVGGFLGWGSMLMKVRAYGGPWFNALFVVHVLSLVLVGGVASRLFARVALARRARAAVTGLLLGLAALDVLCWVFLPMLGIARALLGPVVLLLGIGLLYLVARPLREMWLHVRWDAAGRTEPFRVVIVGGGFAGLYAAMELDRQLGHHRALEITVLDRRNYFLFPPLLPSVATGAIETRQVTYPFRRIFEATNVVFRKETVECIDVKAKLVRARADVDEHSTAVHREIPYDALVLAPGSDTQTFRTPGVAEHAFFMRELGDAVSVRNHIIDCFELAAQEPSEERRAALLRFVVVGGGPTGVELLAEIRDLVEHVLFVRYPEVNPSEVDLVLVQSAPQILPGWHPVVVERASDQLRELEVRVLTGRKVLGVGEFSVTLDGGETLSTRTTVWCAGVKPAGLLAAVDLPKHPSGRVPVEEDLRVPGHPAVFVLGDAAVCQHEGKPLPPLGQVAFQQGTHTGRNLVALIRGRPLKPFRYFNYGALVSVGEHFAAVDLLGVRMSGALAWFVWRTLYLTKLVGFGNKVRVVLDWSLDLLVERSISQISASRQDLRAAAADSHVTLRAGGDT
ncbi:MAG TPA: NAD(P)/FAD-dependent oxidoreductase [Myxococcaceae bacterium]|nr:NAD(P)/FAD-dependent oxidoreductase [Myxococcaceae bacterium]